MRDWKTDAEPYIGPLSEALRRPGGVQTLRPAQTAFALELHQCRGVFLNGRVGVGKAQPVSEPVLTPEGWRPIGDLAPGDRVIGSDGLPIKVLSVHPQGIRDVQKVTFSDGSWTRCDLEHLWTARKRKAGRPPMHGRVSRGAWETHTLKDWKELGLSRKCGEHEAHKCFIPLVQAIQRPEQDVPLDPYTLGALLGDGHFGTSIGFVSMDQDIVDRLVLPEGVTARVLKSQNSGKATQYILSAGGNTRAVGYGAMPRVVKALGLKGTRSSTKFIPDIYMKGSIAQRVAILQGLLDTDGTTAGPSGAVEFSSLSHVMARQVQEIAESLGGRASWGVLSANGNARVLVILPRRFSPFLCRRKGGAYWSAKKRQHEPARAMVSVQPDGQEESVCISVESWDSLYVTRHHILTHNTLCSAIAGTVLGGNLRTLILVPGGIKTETNRHHAEIAKHWQVQPGQMLMSYSQISRLPKEGRSIGDLFGPGLGPQVIIGDEADKLKNVGPGGSAVALQIEQWILDNPETVVVFMTGTCDVTGIPDYAHLIYWALRDKSPLPTRREEIQEWSDVIDKGDMSNAPAVRRALKLGPNAQLDEIREGYQRLLRGTPGIIIEDTPYTQIPMNVAEIPVEPPPELEEHWARLRDLGQRPDGADVDGGPPDPDRIDPMGAWAVARRMGRGLCYIWDPLPPEPWLQARRTYYAWERKHIAKEQLSGRIITPFVAREYAEAQKEPKWLRWEQAQPTYVPQTRTLWLSEAVLDAAEEWGREAPGIIFVDDRDFGAKLAARTGWDYYASGGKTASGKKLERRKEGVSRRTVICSRRSCGVGLNLQFQWNRILFVSPPNNSRDFEQNTGRCHREGAEEGFESVEVSILLTCAEDYASVRKVIRTAQRTAKSLYRQKAIDWPWDRTSEPTTESRAFR